MPGQGLSCRPVMLGCNAPLACRQRRATMERPWHALRPLARDDIIIACQRDTLVENGWVPDTPQGLVPGGCWSAYPYCLQEPPSPYPDSTTVPNRAAWQESWHAMGLYGANCTVGQFRGKWKALKSEFYSELAYRAQHGWSSPPQHQGHRAMQPPPSWAPVEWAQLPLSCHAALRPHHQVSPRALGLHCMGAEGGARVCWHAL